MRPEVYPGPAARAPPRFTSSCPHPTRSDASCPTPCPGGPSCACWAARPPSPWPRPRGLPSLAHAATARRQPAAGPRVEGLLTKLTLDEKISLLHGATDPKALGQAGYVPGVERLGIPPLRLADGPAGVRVKRHATALPAPVLLASAFDPGLARRYGRVIGREGRALGQDVLLSPMVNLIRTPYAGRNFETFSEDPLLSADLVGRGDQGHPGRGPHRDRQALRDEQPGEGPRLRRRRVDEQTLHEVELRAFEAAVGAGAGAVMGAYNKVNGTYACESKALLTEHPARAAGASTAG